MSEKMVRLLVAALGASGVLMSGAASAQNIAVVNGKAVPKTRADFMVEMYKKQGAQDSPQLQKQIREELIDREIIVQEAEKQGYGSKDAVKQNLELARQQIVITAYLDDLRNKAKPSDEELKKEYDTIKAKMGGGKEYHAYHILVNSEDQAKKLIEQLKKGAKFDELAKANSTDKGSAERGGDLDWAQPASFVPEFSNAMVALEKGKFTDTPVKSQFGYHIIRLDDVRDAQFPPLEEVKQQLTDLMTRKKIEEIRNNLRAKAKIQ